MSSTSPLTYSSGNPYRGFRDMLTVYHQTGARTSELAAAEVWEFVSGQIVLGKHKRSKSLRDAAVRRITLAGQALRIVGDLCQRRNPDDPIFTDAKGRPWNRYRLDTRFKLVRTRAGVREDITIYSFRHLGISQALMAGIDAATVAKTVAKMAGTSIGMLEKVYAH